ncbi:beta-lactamase/transpeptidase-like protein [Glonium stellatum]|uniref:Beta-lactamase/transpeptidase-like protein n=1 Tax=Glonium stellatum TaxID=574774 RepID=A0A8E2F8V0_9PEZI|nr:beta-lactamase/transpeptidase-like protein [Glonium stellatum]
MADSNILEAKKCKILEILRLFHIHTASIVVRRLAGQSEHKTFSLQKLERATSDEQNSLEYEVSSRADISFPIASITKVLVAIAFTMATLDTSPNKESRHNGFKDRNLENAVLTTTYNRYKKDPSMPGLRDLPGNPTISHVLSHWGMPSSNHRLFAPDGSAQMSADDVVQYIYELNNSDINKDGESSGWNQYSNLNYVLVGMAIEALWGGTLSDFIDNTLLKPLGIGNSTTTGYQENPDVLQSDRYIVDSQGTLHSTDAPNYVSSGVEAAAMGCYSCIGDLDKIFTNVLERFASPDSDDNFRTSLSRLRARHTENPEYTRLGLFSPGLDSREIGSMSTNRLMFPKQNFTKYRAAPRSKERIETYYHAGSAIGCSCAYALLPHEDAAKAFFVVVLTNTSGPVDASDHILRLILREIYFIRSSGGTFAKVKLKLDGSKNLPKLYKKAWRASSKMFKRHEEEDSAVGLDISTDISGVYKLKDSTQRLEVKSINGVPHITFHGNGGSSRQLRLAWLSSSVVRICVPQGGKPHISIDRLGDADWANLEFQVEMNNSAVEALVRKTHLEVVDRFEREQSQ